MLSYLDETFILRESDLFNLFLTDEGTLSDGSFTACLPLGMVSNFERTESAFRFTSSLPWARQSEVISRKGIAIANFILSFHCPRSLPFLLFHFLLSHLFSSRSLRLGTPRFTLITISLLTPCFASIIPLTIPFSVHYTSESPRRETPLRRVSASGLRALLSLLFLYSLLPLPQLFR
jgi:hypothetical protein